MDPRRQKYSKIEEVAGIATTTMTMVAVEGDMNEMEETKDQAGTGVEVIHMTGGIAEMTVLVVGVAGLASMIPETAT